MTRHLAFYIGSDDTVPLLLREPCLELELELEVAAPEGIMAAVERAADERAEVEVFATCSQLAGLDAKAIETLSARFPVSRWIWIENGPPAAGSPRPPCHARLPVGRLEEAVRRVLVSQVSELRDAQRRFRLDALAAFELFGKLDERERDWLAQRVHLTCYQAGDTIIRRGSAPDGAYFVVDGEVAVVAEQGTQSRTLANLGRGEYFGEMSLLTGELRSATVVANRPTTMLFLAADHFHQFLELNPERAISLSRTLSARLNSVLRGRAQVPRVLGLADAIGGERGGHLARRLAHTLARLLAREVIALDAGLLAPGAASGEGSERRPGEHLVIRPWAADGAGLDWAIDAERTRCELLVVAVPAASGSAAIQAALQRCDQVLILVGDADGSLARARELAVRLGAGATGPTSRIRLLVDGSKPGGDELAQFPGQPDVLRIHGPVPEGEPSPQLDRLARRILRRAVGLVLGGGGMRGFTHAGALEALVAAGIPIDMVGGTSAGAVVAALFAQQMEAESVRAFLVSEVARGAGIFDWTIPHSSMTRGERWRSALSRRFGAMRIEELPIDYFAVASDLVSGQGVLLDSGPLAEACVASSGLPGIFPPVRRGEQILVDGGMVDNVPGVKMKRRGADLVVVVNLTQECAVDLKNATLESSWLGSLLSLIPGVRSLFENPAIPTILARSLDILMYANVRNTSWSFDVEIRPGLVEFTTLGLSGWSTMIDRGRAAAEAAIPEIRRRLAELER